MLNILPNSEKSRRLSSILISAAVLLAGACSGSEPTAPQPPIGTPSAIVSMPGNSFSPFNTTIQVNEIVAWEFPSNEHDVVFTAKAGAPANIPVTSRASVQRAFATIGVYPYDCKIHPGMSGQVTVTQ